jgi:hypothetical protein
VEGEQYAQTEEQEAVAPSFRAQGNTLHAAEWQEDQTGEKDAPEDDQWGGQDAQLAQHARQPEKENGNIGK